MMEGRDAICKHHMIDFKEGKKYRQAEEKGDR